MDPIVLERFPERQAVLLSSEREVDTVTASGTATYDNPDVGTGKTITATDITLDGTDANCYTLSNETATTIGSITRQPQVVIPDAPTLASRTTSSITLNTMEPETTTQTPVEYGISKDNGATWTWQATWYHRRLQPVTTTRQVAQKIVRKFCRSKDDKNRKTHPEKPEKGKTGCVLDAGGDENG